MLDPDVAPDSTAGRARAVAPPFECSWSDGGLNAAWVHLAGELDIDTTPLLEWMLHDPHSQAQLVVLDMRDLAFMDSSGVHAIVNAGAYVRQLGHRLVILRGPPDVDRLFALTGNARYVDDGDLAPVDPSVQALLRLGDSDGAA
ncbi:MAG TPA: STAS domain-containing protein [Solirubrobacteraceae bacterium]